MALRWRQWDTIKDTFVLFQSLTVNKGVVNEDFCSFVTSQRTFNIHCLYVAVEFDTQHLVLGQISRFIKYSYLTTDGMQ